MTRYVCPKCGGVTYKFASYYKTVPCEYCKVGEMEKRSYR